MKNLFYLFLLLISISCGSEPLPLPESPDPEPKPEEEKIEWNLFAEKFQETLSSVYGGSSGTYITRPDKPDFNYWFNAHVLDVLVDGYLRTNDKDYLIKMKNLLRGIKVMNRSYWQVYVDDMAWLGISSMNAWKATGDNEYKDVAIYILSEIRKAHTPVLGGGLQWRFDQPNGKNACSTAPGGILALRLYAADKKEADLIFAKELFEWELKNLLNPTNYLIWDNLSLDANGNKILTEWMFTYNVGTFIGMARDLYVNTGEQKYLDIAVRSARASVTSSDMVKGKMFLESGDHDGGLFKGILVRYLTELVYTEGITLAFKNTVIDFLNYNATLLYEEGTTPFPGVLASAVWNKRPERPQDLSTQLSAMMLAETIAKFDRSELLK